MTPIKAIPRTETKYFGKELVQDFWLEMPANPSPGPKNNDYLNRLKTYLESEIKDGVICVYSEELSSKNLCESLARARDNGNRIYILTNAYHAEMKNLEGCLIRYGGGKRIGSFILTNPNSDSSSGFLFTGMFSDGSINFATNFMLGLDSSQVSILFRYFCYQFWNKAEKEVIGHEERPVEAAPLDIYPPVEDSCDFQYLRSVWGKEAQNAQVSTSLLNENSYLKFTNFSNSKILSLLSGIDAALVRSLKQKKNKIFALDSDSYINSVQTSDGLWLVPKIDATSEEEVYAILLNSEQKELLNKHLITLANKTLNEYCESNIRENLSGKTIFHLGNSVSAKYKINAESRSKLQSVSPSELFPKETFENLKPDFQDDSRSVSIIYEWTNIPFTLPSGSKEHQLYKDWENSEKKILDYISVIHSDISETEKNEGMFSRIKNLFVGKKQKFSEYRKVLENSKSIKYSSLEKTSLEEEIKRLNEIRASVKKDKSEISEENRKAKILEKIENTKNERKQREDDLVDEKKKLQEAEETIKSQSDDLEKIKKQAEKNKVEDAGKIINEEKQLEDLNIKKNKASNEVTLLETQIKKYTADEKAYADEKKKSETELADKKKKLNEAEEAVKNQSASLEELKKQAKERNDENEEKVREETKKIKDINVVKNRISNEIISLETQIKKLGNEETSLGEQLKNPGKEVSNSGTGSVLDGLTGGGKKANQSHAEELSVPQYPRLPLTGNLYTLNEQDYLAIAYWEDYNKGKEEAARLSSTTKLTKLCAKGEKNG